MIKLKIDELAELLGKTRQELEEMLNKDDVIELNLSKRNLKNNESCSNWEDDELRIYE